MAEKIQGYQFTIDLDDGGMARSLKSIRDEAKALKNAMQSNFTEIKTSEGAMAAYAQKVTDAGRAIDAQRLVIEKLKNEQNGLDLTTEKGRQTYLKYENQINSSKRAISNLQAQQERAKSSLDLQASGVLKLKEATESAERSSNSYVEMLKAQGRTFTAQKAQLDGLRNVHSKMESQLVAEKQRLTDLSATYGTADKRYTDQIVRVNELSAKYATNRQEISKLNAAVGGMSDRTVKVKDTVSNATSSIKSGLSKVKNSAIVASGGIAVLGAAALSGAKKASTLQNEYKVTTNLLVTGGEKTAEATKNVAQMQKDGMEYSVKYGKSQKDIAEQYQELVKRGYSSKEALGAMRSELQASVASGDDFNDVVKVSSQVVDAFGMRTDNTTQMTKNSKRAVNELAYAADMTATDFQSLGKGMEYVGDSAHSAGFKLSETSAAMGELSNHGLEADKAGTGLRKVVNSISDALASQEVAQKGVSGAIADYNEQIAKHQRKINELNADVKNGTKTQKAATSAIQTQKDAISDLSQKIQDAKNSSGGTSLLDKLGIKRSDLVDANGNFKSLSTIMAVVNDKTKDLGKAKKASVFNALFGTTGQQAGIILAQHNKELSELTDKVQKAGDKGQYVATLAEKNSQTAQQSEARFKQAWSNLTIMFGSKLLPYMTEAANSLSKEFNNKDTIKGIEKTAGGIGNVAGSILKVGEWSAKHIDDIETFAKVLATVWVVDKVRKFARATQDFFDLMGIGKSKIIAETEQVNIETKAYQELAAAKSEAAGAGAGTISGGTVSSKTVASSATTTYYPGGTAKVADEAEQTVAKSSSKWSLLGSTLGAKLINGAGLALTAWDVGSSVAKAVNSKSANVKYSAAAKTTGALLGGGIGAAVGGPFGAMLGSQLGDQLGSSKLASKLVSDFVKNWNANTKKVNIKTPKISTKTAYSELLKAQKNYISQKEKNDLAAVNELHKTGNMSDAEYQKQVAAIKKAAKDSKTVEDSSGKDRTTVAKYYASQRQKIEESYNKKESSILNKYDKEIRYSEEQSGKNSLATKKLIAEKKAAIGSASSKKSKQLSDLNVKYAKNDMTQEAKLHETLTGKIQLESNKQQKILDNLTKNKGKLSQQQLRTAVKDANDEYKQTVSYANKAAKEKGKAADNTYNSVIKAATRQENDAISAANNQYKQTVAAANNQYKSNSQWAEQQRAAVKKKAEDQRTASVNAAFDQYNKTKQHAENQYQGVVNAAEKQRKNAIDKANDQRDKINGAAADQSKGVLGHAVKQTNGSMEANQKQGEGTTNIWAKIGKFFNDLVKPFGVKGVTVDKTGFAYTAMGMPAYASGTGQISSNQLALVGEAGPELAYKPYSGKVRVLGTKGAQFEQLQAGEMVLNARDTKKLLSGTYTGKLPAYSGGTTDISSFISKLKSGASSVWNNISDTAMDTISKITNPVKTLTDIANKTFNLDSVSDVGSVARDFSKGAVKQSIEGIAGVIKKIIDNFGGSSANPSGSGVMRWKPDVIRALKMNGFDATDYQVNAWLKVIQRESNGDPHAINNWDSNAKAGHPSKGLVQTIDRTFSAYKFAGHGNIWNGFDDLLAGIHYMKSRYGSGTSAFARVSGKEGYANGGVISNNKLIEVAEGNIPEAVIPWDLSKRSRAYQLMQQSLDYFKGQDGTNNSANSSASLSTDNEQLKLMNSKFDNLLTMFGKLLGLSDAQLAAIEAGNDPTKLYTRMAKDQQLANYQAIRS